MCVSSVTVYLIIYMMVNYCQYYCERWLELRKIIFTLMIVSILLFSAAVPGTMVYAASRSCISELSIAAGDDGLNQLEKDGYTAVYQNLNPSKDSQTKIYLGYKLGSSPITGLAVSSENRKSFSIGTIKYSQVSSVNLNQGNGGSPVYLYFTKSEEAGRGIVSLNTVCRDENNDVNLLDCINEGSVSVRTADGNAADFEEGISGTDLYMFMVRENTCLPYISDIKTVTVKKGENTFSRIVSSGCDYYVKDCIGTGGDGCTYLCYNRTDDASDAVRYAAVSDSENIDGIGFVSAGSFSDGNAVQNLYYSKSAEIGNPVTEITKGSVMGNEFTLGEWTQAYFRGAPSGARSEALRSSTFEKLSESETPYTELQIMSYLGGSPSGVTDLYMVLSSENLTVPAQTEPSLSEELEALEEDANASEADALAQDGELRDAEDAETVKEESAAEEAEQPVEGEIAYGSAIGSGGLAAIAVLTIIAVILVFILVMFRNRKNDDKGKE